MKPEGTEIGDDAWVTTVFDRLIALVCLICLAPVYAIIALAIKMEGLFDSRAVGPAIWTATRISKGQPFKMFKFRAVRANVPLQDYENPDRPYSTYQTNPDATRVGRFLLKWYLDELPQLLNVLRGEMRLAGPRPVALWEYERELAEGAESKKRVKAGWAGLTQAHKGRSASRQENMRLDAEYVRNITHMNPTQRLRYDLSLLIQTLLTAIGGEGR